MSTDLSFNPTYSHVGLCVSDMARAKAFYMEALGFQEGAVFDAHNTVNNLLGLTGNVEMTSQMMSHGHFILELIHFNEPAPINPGQLRPMNRIGLTHLSFTVADVDAAVAHVENCGGTILHQTRTEVEFSGSDPSVLIFCTDPDGTRIELYKPSSALSA